MNFLVIIERDIEELEAGAKNMYYQETFIIRNPYHEIRGENSQKIL